MRWLWFLLLLPLASAQAPDLVLEDTEGDVQIQVLGDDTASPPAGSMDSTDLRHLRILEDVDHLDFRVGLTSLEEGADFAYRDQVISIWFRHGEMTYKIEAISATNQRWSSHLYQEDNATVLGYTQIAEVPWRYHVDTDEFGSPVPRELLRDEQGAPLGPMSTLEDVRVRAATPYFVGLLAGTPLRLTGVAEETLLLIDEMGIDDPGAYAMQLGLDRIGPIQLRSAEPYRFSNGEASTFVYWIDALNGNDEEGIFSLSTSQVPAGWSVDLPGGTFELAAGQDLRFPVVLRTQFAHAHGSTERFFVEMQEERGGGVGRIDLGIHYPDVPQPAGHHDLLHFWHAPRLTGSLSELAAPLHAALWNHDGTEVAYMNAAGEDEFAQNVPADFRYCGEGGAVIDAFLNALSSAEQHCHFIDLQPGLRMGLDFQTDQEGRLVFEIDTTEPMRAVKLIGGLVLRQPVYEETAFGGQTVYEELVLATIPETDLGDLDMGETVSLDLPVTPTPESDYIPYQPGQGLRLDLRILNDGINDGALMGMDLEPRLLPGGTLRLPLNEYHDPIEELPDLGGVRWSAGDTQRDVNPGKTVLFQATLHNSGATDQFDVRLLGVNEAWGTLNGPERIRLERNETADYVVIVQVPDDAVIGDRADLVLEAAGRDDPTQRALLQLRAAINTDVEIPDEAHLIPESGPTKKSPGPALPLLALGLLVLARRR